MRPPRARAGRPRSRTPPRDPTSSAMASGRPAASTASPASPGTPRTASRCGCASRATSSTGARSSGARRTRRPRTAAMTPRRSRSTSSVTSRASTTTSTRRRQRLHGCRRPDVLADEADRRLEHAHVRSVRHRAAPAPVRHAELVGEVLDLQRRSATTLTDRWPRRPSSTAAPPRSWRRSRSTTTPPTAGSALNPVSGRVVSLQTRAPGATTWLAAGTMAAGSDVRDVHEDAHADRRTSRSGPCSSTPTDEGLPASTSSAVIIDVGPCKVAPCPQTAGGD